MKLVDLSGALQCRHIHKSKRSEETEIRNVMASDLMSDVLVVDKERLLLVTSLPSDQTIRTADMVGALAVLVVNNKTLPDSMVVLARELDMTLMTTPLDKFSTCVRIGRLLDSV